MGQLLDIEPGKIAPSQDFLKEKTLRYIEACFREGRLGDLPPTPIVRHHPNKDGYYIAIDGHNLLATSHLRGEKCVVYVADSANDQLPGDDTITKDRNRDLREKFALVPDIARELENKDITTIADLCQTTNTTQEN